MVDILCAHFDITFPSLIYRVYQKKVDKSEIALYFVKSFNVRTFLLIKVDCFGTYNVE